MIARDDGGPAFPAHGTMGEVVEHGMSLRDYFAAHAPEPPKCWHGGSREFSDVIEWPWFYARKMLAERAK